MTRKRHGNANSHGIVRGGHGTTAITLHRVSKRVNSQMGRIREQRWALALDQSLGDDVSLGLWKLYSTEIDCTAVL